jgi:hypothetical protein
LLVHGEGFLKRGRGGFVATGARVHFAEVVQRIPLQYQTVCSQRDRNGLARELFGLRIFSAMRLDERRDLSPEGLGHRIVVRAELAPLRSEGFRVVVAAERAKCAAALRCGGG